MTLGKVWDTQQKSLSFLITHEILQAYCFYLNVYGLKNMGTIIRNYLTEMLAISIIRSVKVEFITTILVAQELQVKVVQQAYSTAYLLYYTLRKLYTSQFFLLEVTESLATVCIRMAFPL